MKKIKTKVLIAIVIMVTVLQIMLLFSWINTYNNYSVLKDGETQSKISTSSEKVNTIIALLESGVKNLSAISEENIQNGIDINDILKDTLTSLPNAIGGGIWYQPFVIDSDETDGRVWTYGYWNGDIVEVSKDSYTANYLNEDWYIDIKNNNSEDNVFWTKPYIDASATKSLMITVGSKIYNASGDFVGVVTLDWGLDAINVIQEASKVTDNSIVIFADITNDFIISSSENAELVGKNLDSIGWYNDQLKDGDTLKINKTKSKFFNYTLRNNIVFCLVVPKAELYADISGYIWGGIIMFFIGSVIIYLFIYFYLNKVINKPVVYLAQRAKELGNGDFSSQMKLEGNDEFTLLENSFNEMSTSIQSYISSIKEITATQGRINAELSIAGSIQQSMLPKTFPAFADIKEIEIYATMNPAKEVGGDFYDYFRIDENTIGMVIADVSGKGIPAAMFMLTAKTLIKTAVLSGMSAANVFSIVNNALCENNHECMFLTAFLAYYDIKTKIMTYVNAGHNLPVLKRNGKSIFLEAPPCFILAGMTDMPYAEQTMQLQDGDTLLLYTDGVTEAMNHTSELYGNDRLLEVVDDMAKDLKIVNMEKNLSESIIKFADGAEQSDDITILFFKIYKTVAEISKNITVSASVEEFDTVRDFVLSEVEKVATDQGSLMQLELAVEEIFINIAHYAYHPIIGKATVKLDIFTDPFSVTIQFLDKGKPFNPLEKEDPNIDLDADERDIGGLGIFLTKKFMDNVTYCYDDNTNILTITKKLDSQNKNNI